MTANKIFLWFLCHSSHCYRLQAASSRAASMHHPEHTNNGNKGRCLFGKQEKVGRLPSPWHQPREDLQRLAAMCHQMIACTAASCQHSCRHHTDGCFGCCTCGTVSVHWSFKFTKCTVVWSACVDALLYLSMYPIQRGQLSVHTRDWPPPPQHSTWCRNVPWGLCTRFTPY